MAAGSRLQQDAGGRAAQDVLVELGPHLRQLLTDPSGSQLLMDRVGLDVLVEVPQYSWIELQPFAALNVAATRHRAGHLEGGEVPHAGTEPPPMQSEVIGGLMFVHDQRVLAPRLWTEAQAAWARDLAAEVPDGPMLELCCGVGHIGLLTLLGNTRSLVMIDASEVACEFAQRNAQKAGLADRVEVRVARIETWVGEEAFPLVIADPPWVPSSKVARFPHDPMTAIDGGEDGLGPTRACLALIGRVLHEAGRSVLQVGTRAQVDQAREWLRAHPGLRLETGDIRAFGDRGVLMLLRRPAADST